MNQLRNSFSIFLLVLIATFLQADQNLLAPNFHSSLSFSLATNSFKIILLHRHLIFLNIHSHKNNPVRFS
jgi:hypothetical protein